MENQEPIKVDDKRLVAQPTKNIAPQNSNALVMTAMEKGYAPEFIEKMMELEERRYKEDARRAYFEALSNFKLEAPRLEKDAYNAFFKSKYTTLGKLLETFNPILAKHGLTLSHPTPKQTESSLTGGARLTHRMGHSETFEMTMPIDQASVGKQSGQRSRNALQDIKSTFTYLRSAATEGILGVSGTDATLDDDGNGCGSEFITEDQVKKINTLLKAKKFTDARIKKFLEFAGGTTVDTIPSKNYKEAVTNLEKATIEKPKEREPGEEG